MTTDARPAGPPPLWRRVLPFATAAGLLALVIARLDVAVFVEHLVTIDYPVYAAFALVFVAALLVADSFATAYVLRMVLGPIRLRRFIVLRGGSYVPSLFNHHLGQAWLTYHLSRLYDARLLRTAGTTLLTYATTFAWLFLFAAMSLALDPDRFAWLPVVVGAIAVLALGYLAVLALWPRVLLGWRLTAPLAELGVRGHVRALVYRGPHMIVLFIGTWVPFLFFDVDIPLTDALALVPPLMVVVALPITPQGIGTRDAFALQLFSGFAAGAAGERTAAVAAATVSWAVAITVIQIPLSLVCFHGARRLAENRGSAP